MVTTYFATGGAGAARLPIGLTAAAGAARGRWIPRPIDFFREGGEGSSFPFSALAGGVLFCRLDWGGVFFNAWVPLDSVRSDELASWLPDGVAGAFFCACSF